MSQLAMFGIMTRPAKHNGVRQSIFHFTSHVDSGRRGEMSPVWLDIVLHDLKVWGIEVSLTDLQSCWDKGMRPLPTLEHFLERKNGPKPAFALPTLPLSLPAPVKMLALPSPDDPRSRARKLASQGYSLRRGAVAMGIPLTTFRRLIGKVK